MAGPRRDVSLSVLREEQQKYSVSICLHISGAQELLVSFDTCILCMHASWYLKHLYLGVSTSACFNYSWIEAGN